MPPRHEDESTERKLACPFYRFNYHQYHECGKFVLKNYCALQQHLERKHRAEYEFYCSHCYRFFKTEESKNRHVITASTQHPNCASTYRGHDEITWPEWSRTFEKRGSNQKTRPRKGKNAALPSVEVAKWFWLWDQLFRGHDRPPEDVVHLLDNPVEEAIVQVANQRCIQSVIERYFAVNALGRCTAAELAEQIHQELTIVSRPNPSSRRYRITLSSNTMDNTSAAMLIEKTNSAGHGLFGLAADPVALTTAISEPLWEQASHRVDIDGWQPTWLSHGSITPAPLLSSQVGEFREMGGFAHDQTNRESVGAGEGWCDLAEETLPESFGVGFDGTGSS
ncbi:hypothetical protein QBC34DRAFT_397783 [Podospora aff. communis PSN243]|uniref:C2H2-type domain-containing protein n=1 Tax=Podospora aff. communis PSN243 TaxID=3040156 RepID=A0AAV9GX97_9PEZI|nr:hypothetical protein QBC34DRAFT_397783 [Podospora aff. communis PSN243]